MVDLYVLPGMRALEGEMTALRRHKRRPCVIQQPSKLFRRHTKK